MKPLKIGDRVRVYGTSQTGWYIATHKKSSFVGLVVGICNDPEWVNVKDFYGEHNNTFHRKQLRLLKPKAKPRELWVKKPNPSLRHDKTPYSYWEAEVSNLPENELDKDFKGAVLFREVERKRRGMTKDTELEAASIAYGRLKSEPISSELAFKAGAVYQRERKMPLEKAMSQEHLTHDTVDAQFCSDWLKDEIKHLFHIIGEQQAQLTIMREVLEEVAAQKADLPMIHHARQALASNAGSQLLERVKRLEAARTAAEQMVAGLEWAKMQFLSEEWGAEEHNDASANHWRVCGSHIEDCLVHWRKALSALSTADAEREGGER